MKKILIALDYNPSAQTVAEKGFALAKTMQAATVLLHVMENPRWLFCLRSFSYHGFRQQHFPSNGVACYRR